MNGDLYSNKKAVDLIFSAEPFLNILKGGKMDYEVLKTYQPQKESDGFEVIKANGLVCNINYARLEESKSDNPEFNGRPCFRYELEVIGGTTDHLGRKFWKRYWRDENPSLMKLADFLWTLEQTFTNDNELTYACEAIIDKSVIVRAWGWTPEGRAEPIQSHVVKGWAKESDNKAPF